MKKAHRYNLVLYMARTLARQVAKRVRSSFQGIKDCAASAKAQQMEENRYQLTQRKCQDNESMVQEKIQSIQEEAEGIQKQLLLKRSLLQLETVVEGIKKQ